MPYPDSEYPSILRGRDKRDSQRLLAAAPEMLAALKQCLLRLRVDCEEDSDLREDAEAAIAKAEGRRE